VYKCDLDHGATVIRVYTQAALTRNGLKVWKSVIKCGIV